MGPACAVLHAQNGRNHLLPENGDDNCCHNILLLELLRICLKNIAQSKLAKEVLAEIPAQLLGYMKANQIAPQNKHNLYPHIGSTLSNGTLDDIDTSYVAQTDCYSDDE